jgi:hypothetical protein
VRTVGLGKSFGPVHALRVHGHQIVGADELVQLDVVDVAALPVLGGVQDNEQVIGVRVDLGHAVAFDAVAYGESVEAEHIGQNPDGVAVTAQPD